MMDLSSAVSRVLCLESVSITVCHVNNGQGQEQEGKKKRLIIKGTEDQ